MDIDEALVEDRRVWLNNNAGGGWQRVEGLFALTGVEIRPSGPEFNPARGVIVVAFVKQDTGEIRVYAANSFQRR